MACACCNPPWNGFTCPCREPLDVRMTIAAPYSVNANLGGDPIANAIGTYVLSRDRAADVSFNTGHIYYSLTPSGQSYSVDFPDSSSWLDVALDAVYAVVSVVCYAGLSGSTGIVTYELTGKFLPNFSFFGSFDVFRTRVSSNVSTSFGIPTAACSASSQATARITVLDSIQRYNPNGTVVTGGGAYSATYFDNATVTIQLNG